MSSIYEVAQKAKVSVSTVSRCLNESSKVAVDTRIRVLQAAGELGFELKKYRRRKSSSQNVIGVIITEHNDFFAAAISSIEQIAKENNISVIICNSHINIAIMSGPTSNKPGLDRLNGYLAALRDNNIPIKEEYILYGEFKKDLALALTQKLLKNHPEVTAVFSANLIMSFGCLEAISEAKVKIPDTKALNM